jgi:uncharacterized caspase-like protein
MKSANSWALPAPIRVRAVSQTFTTLFALFFGIACALYLPASAQGRNDNAAAFIIAYDYTDAEDRSLILRNTLSDAKLIEKSMRAAGVSPVSLQLNTTTDELFSQLKEFSATVNQDTDVVLFYSGHALQVSGKNYLLGGDGTTTIILNDLIETLRQNSRSVIVILDGCRNNPFAGAEPDRPPDGAAAVTVRGISRIDLEPTVSQMSLLDLQAASSGLARIDGLRGKNVLIFFATEPGNVAIDSSDQFTNNGPFATALATELLRKIEIEVLIRRVSRRVTKSTHGKQTPWRQGSIEHQIYLAGKKHFPVP